MTKVKNEDARFLESITFFGNDILIPIDRIKWIRSEYVDQAWQIKIFAEDEIDLVEYFGNDEDKLKKRYEQIKNILKAK